MKKKQKREKDEIGIPLDELLAEEQRMGKSGSLYYSDWQTGKQLGWVILFFKADDGDYWHRHYFPKRHD